MMGKASGAEGSFGNNDVRWRYEIVGGLFGVLPHTCRGNVL